MQPFRIEVRTFREGDVELLGDGLARAGRGAPARERAQLAWRYAQAPHGARVAFALDGEGRALAGIAATRQRAWLEGAEVHWLEVGDLFNDFARGAGLCRARALLAAGAAFAEEFGGFAPEKHPLMYGLPDRRAHRLGRKHLEWEVLRSENRLELALAGPAPARAALEVSEVSSFPPEVAGLFAGFAAGRPALLVKDKAYLDWRHGRPGFRRALVARAGEPVGLAVVGAGWLQEWVVRPDDEQAVAALLAWARGAAAADGRAVLAAVAPDTAPEWQLFQRHGFRVHGTREYLCFRSFQRPAIMSWLFHHWSYSRGDTLRA